MDTQEVKFKGWGSHVRILAISSGVIGLIEAATYLALTITALISYTDCSDRKIVDIKTFGDILLEGYFVSGNETDGCDTIVPVNSYIKSDTLFPWIIVILAFSALWMIASGLMIFGVIDKLTKLSAFFIIGWSSITIAVCVIDLIIGILLGLDLGNLPEVSSNAERAGLIMWRFMIGFMMTMAFKGYILWIFNCASSILLISLGVEILRTDDEPDDSNQEYPNQNMARSPINAYETSPSLNKPTWLSEQPTIDRPRVQSQGFNRSQSQYGYGEVNHGYMMETPRYQQQQPLASIMKKSVADRNSEQFNKTRNRNDVDVPSPDYSPPQTRARPPYNQQSSMNSQSYYNNQYRR